MAALATSSSTFASGKAISMARKPNAARRSSIRRANQVSAKYEQADGKFFDLSDLENTIGSWDMYGVDDKSRYNGLQSEFFERAASGLTRREYLTGLVAAGGAAILTWGLKGSKDAKLPITIGPKNGGEPGPRGRK